MCREANLPDILPEMQDEEDIQAGIINNYPPQNADRFHIEGQRIRDEIVQRYF